MGQRILVVDDSLTVRQQVSRALTQAGFLVLEAVDGQDAIEKVTVTQDISLVVCDINMPRMSGLEFLEQLQKQPMAVAIPVVMLTTEGHPELVQQAKKLGARGWIVKPFKPELLVAAVRKLAGPAPTTAGVGDGARAG